MNISGTMKYEAIETGCWILSGDDGQAYRPVQTPSKLQRNGLRVTVQCRPDPDRMSIFMRGKPIIIERIVAP